MKASQNKRAALAAQQNNICPICKGQLPPGKGRRVYDPDHNIMLCWPCSAFRIHYNSSMARGVTPPMLDAYEARSPVPEPDVQPHKKIQRNTLLSNRWAFATGADRYQDGLVGWDKRFNLSGPVINPDTDQPIELNEYSLENRSYGMSLLGGE